MFSSGVPGLSYAISYEGEVIENKAFGLKRRGGSDPITEETVFIVGSVSKSFTALAIMQLIEAEEIELNAPISQYINNLLDSEIGKVSVRQLLSHTSGLSIVQGNQSQNDYSMDSDALASRIVTLAEISPEFAAGERWEYSNANYQILGRLIEVISGQSYTSYIRDRILQPSGMNDSFVHNASPNSRLAAGHRPWFGTKLALSSNKTGRGSGPQGGIVSSARDMARYLGIMMNQQDDILSAEGKALMMRPASDVSPEYGFGWFVDPHKGVVYHSGSNPGYEALATMIPAEKKGAVVLVNGSSGFAFGQTRELRYGLSARILGTDYQGEKTPWLMRAVFGLLILAPFLFLIGIVKTWKKRGDKTNKPNSSVVAKLRLLLPLLLSVILAYILLVKVPNSFGATYGAASVFQPDIGVLLIATAVTGIVWALVGLFTLRS